MKEKPLVSVIIPAYNAEKYIAEAIESIINQTYKNLEIIVLDDASTDNTGRVVEEYARKDSRIQAIHNENNLYIAGNRNKGISLAKGKYIVWQDADDISVPYRIEKQVSLMESSPDVGICGSYLHSFSDDKNLDVRVYSNSDKQLRKNIFKFSPVAQPAAIVRKTCFDELGNYDLSMPPAEDIDMSFRIGTRYKFANIQEVLLNYREHPHSATFSKMKKILERTLYVRNKYSSGYGYTVNLSDKIAFFLTWFMRFLPPSVVIILFKVLRVFIVKDVKLIVSNRNNQK